QGARDVTRADQDLSAASLHPAAGVGAADAPGRRCRRVGIRKVTQARGRARGAFRAGRMKPMNGDGGVPTHHRSEKRRATEGGASAAPRTPPPATVQAPVSGRLPFSYVVRQLVLDRWMSQSDCERALAIGDRA